MDDQIEGLPHAPAEEKPKIRSAPGFQNRIRPSRSGAMIASETVVRIRCAASGQMLPMPKHSAGRRACPHSATRTTARFVKSRAKLDVCAHVLLVRTSLGTSDRQD